LDFAELLVDRAGVLVTPGTEYGTCGEGFFRVSLTVPDDRLDQALARMRSISLG
jgi:LL-diaminopimelate aminotransferase